MDDLESGPEAREEVLGGGNRQQGMPLRLEAWTADHADDLHRIGRTWLGWQNTLRVATTRGSCCNPCSRASSHTGKDPLRTTMRGGWSLGPRPRRKNWPKGVPTPPSLGEGADSRGVGGLQLCGPSRTTLHGGAPNGHVEHEHECAARWCGRGTHLATSARPPNIDSMKGLGGNLFCVCVCVWLYRCLHACALPPTRESNYNVLSTACAHCPCMQVCVKPRPVHCESVFVFACMRQKWCARQTVRRLRNPQQ